VAHLSPLLKQGAKWVWTDEAQDAFLRLRQSFARSIQLVHPREDAPYAIHTDASKLGINAILTQKSHSEETNCFHCFQSVESHRMEVLHLRTGATRCGLCSSEIQGLHDRSLHLTVYSDNKALSFLKRCNLTTDRVTLGNAAARI
jgi:uncharacterized CHY-type Zn-finger protein